MVLFFKPLEKNCFHKDAEKIVGKVSKKHPMQLCACVPLLVNTVEAQQRPATRWKDWILLSVGRSCCLNLCIAGHRSRHDLPLWTCLPLSRKINRQLQTAERPRTTRVAHICVSLLCSPSRLRQSEPLQDNLIAPLLRATWLSVIWVCRWRA